MKIEILDSIREGDATCLLCKSSLYEYVTSLPDDFRDFYIQRGIVTNRFLDNLWATLAEKRHIPSIVLVAGPNLKPQEIGAIFDLGSEFKVLDGLQRSHRLREIWDTIKYIEHDFVDQEEFPVARVTRKVAQTLRAEGLSPQVFQKILEAKRAGVDIHATFTDNTIWLEVWIGLTEAQQIQKMLVLNAGHKSVNIKHQIELLFWSNFDALQNDLKPGTLFREKDKATTSYSKERRQGEFHFAHLISAFVSLAEGGTVTTNAEFSAAQSFTADGSNDALFDVDDHLLSAFAGTLKLLDHELRDELGIRWLGREVVLVGIFGAIGSVAHTHPDTKIETLSRFNASIKDYVSILNLEEFEKWRNTLELSKVNIGNMNRRAVLNATKAFLEGRISGPVDWQSLNAKGVANDAS